MKKFLLIFLAFLLTSCVHETKPNFVDPSLRMDDVLGVSVLPPQEEGWQVLHKDKTQLVLGKKGPSDGSTYIAFAKIFKLPKIETEQQFMEYVSDAKKAQQPEERFKVIQNRQEIIKGGTNHIIKYHSIAEDQIATSKFGNKTMLLETIGYTFQHPKNHSVGVELGYSYRYHVGNEDKKLVENANLFLDNVTITDL